MQWSRERCKINLIIVARDYNNTMVVNYIYFVLQSHWKGFGMYSFFIYFSQGVVYVYINVYVCVYTYICSMCMCVCVYIYIYMCVYIYTYICVYEPFKETVFFIGSDISNLTKMRFEISLLMGGMSPWVVYICLAFIKGVLRVGVCMYMYVHVYVYMYMCMCVCMCVYVCICVCVYVYVYIII